MKYIKFVVAAIAVASVCSCRVERHPYVEDAQRDSAMNILQTYEDVILPNDVLDIEVSSLNPEAVQVFNSYSGMVINSLGEVVRMQANYALSGFLVDQQGVIQFPVLGKLNVAGISRDSLARYIQQRVISEGYVNDPVVTVTLNNFRVTVVGEVKNPNQFHSEGARMTLFEALALAGDVTMYGRTDNVMVVREQNGTRQVGEVNLTSKDVFDSPYYYLRQNDIVYVEPTEKHKKEASRNENIPKYISATVSAAVAAVNIWRIAIQSARYR